MSAISRREFLAGVGLVAGSAVLSRNAPLAWAADPAPKVKGSDLVTLGRSGLKTTVLGLGTGTVSGSQQRALGFDGFTRLVRHALDRGVRYIDTADSYKTHEYVRRALDGVARDKYFIQSKSFARDPKKAKEDLERFLRELNVEYVDTALMHCMTKGDWPTEMRPVMDVFEEAKRKGQIKAFGISCHGYEPLVAAAQSDWPDVQLVRINPFNVAMDAAPEKVVAEIKKMHDKGRGVIGMKIFGENGFGSREKRLQSLKYVLGLGTVDCFTIGFRSIAEFDETMDLIEQCPPRAA